MKVVTAKVCRIVILNREWLLACMKKGNLEDVDYTEYELWVPSTSKKLLIIYKNSLFIKYSLLKTYILYIL